MFAIFGVRISDGALLSRGKTVFKTAAIDHSATLPSYAKPSAVAGPMADKTDGRPDCGLMADFYSPPWQ